MTLPSKRDFGIFAGVPGTADPMPEVQGVNPHQFTPEKGIVERVKDSLTSDKTKQEKALRRMRNEPKTEM